MKNIYKPPLTFQTYYYCDMSIAGVNLMGIMGGGDGWSIDKWSCGLSITDDCKSEAA